MLETTTDYVTGPGLDQEPDQDHQAPEVTPVELDELVVPPAAEVQEQMAAKANTADAVPTANSEPVDADAPESASTEASTRAPHPAVAQAATAAVKHTVAPPTPAPTPPKSTSKDTDTKQAPSPPSDDLPGKPTEQTEHSVDATDHTPTGGKSVTTSETDDSESTSSDEPTESGDQPTDPGTEPATDSDPDATEESNSGNTADQTDGEVSTEEAAETDDEGHDGSGGDDSGGGDGGSDHEDDQTPPTFRYALPETLEDDLDKGRISVHPAIAEGLRGTIGGDIDFLVAENADGEPRGQAGINWKAPVDKANREALGVPPESYVPNISFVEVPDGHKGHGIGTAMIKTLIAEATRRGYDRVFLNVAENNPRAKDLYVRLGFVDVGHTRSTTAFERNADGTYGDPISHVTDLMVKNIQPAADS